MSTQTSIYILPQHSCVVVCAHSARCSRSTAGLYLAFNLSLSPLDFLKLPSQVFILQRQCLHTLLETTTLLLRPSQLVTVNLILCENKWISDQLNLKQKL